MSNNYRSSEDEEFRLLLIVGFIVIATIVAVIISLMFGVPQYKVWQRGKAGEAELRQAESNRQITTLEAKAKQESAKALAEAEVIRAEGVAKANKIIGESLRDNDGYLQYLWVQSLQEGGNDVIYIPTEANIPIMEAGRRPTPPAEPVTQ